MINLSVDEVASRGAAHSRSLAAVARSRFNSSSTSSAREVAVRPKPRRTSVL